MNIFRYSSEGQTSGRAGDEQESKEGPCVWRTHTGALSKQLFLNRF